MKNTTKYIGVLFALLFALVVPSLAQSQHLTNSEVNTAFGSLNAHNSGMIPDFIAEAWLYGDGVTVWDDGSYKLDSSSTIHSPYSAYAPGVFYAKYYQTGDPILAACAAIQYYLTHDEFQEIDNPELYGHGYQYLNWMPSIFNDYSDLEDGGGDHDQT